MKRTKINQTSKILYLFIIMISSFLWQTNHLAAEEKSGLPKMAFFGFRLINTTIEPPSKAEFDRLDLLNGIMQEWLKKSGKYSVIQVPEAVIEDLKKGQDLGQCACETDYGKRVGADIMGWGTVEKISNLILNINVYVYDVKREIYPFVKSVDIRSNDDKSWTRGLKWLLRYYGDQIEGESKAK